MLLPLTDDICAPCAEVDALSDATRQTAHDLTDTLSANPSWRALAACQVGLPVRIAVVRGLIEGNADAVTTLVNARVTRVFGGYRYRYAFTVYEDVHLRARRWQEVEVTWTQLDGTQATRWLKHEPAQQLQLILELEGRQVSGMPIEIRSRPRRAR